MAGLLSILGLSLTMTWSTSTMLIMRRRHAQKNLLPFVVGFGPIIAYLISVYRSSSGAEVSGSSAARILHNWSLAALVTLVAGLFIFDASDGLGLHPLLKRWLHAPWLL
ncbi:hypothetical protein ATY30_28355 [Sinorhizobium americanum]|nr:hypothetical protein CO664_24050 [Sinorhizobium sp. NG07B]POH24962.1 hypothetical protein ATY30_28355 [Sinorhizobium americanum]